MLRLDKRRLLDGLAELAEIGAIEAAAALGWRSPTRTRRVATWS
jgi:hypothetical protein